MHFGRCPIIRQSRFQILCAQMTTRSITATQLARNFSDLLNQVRYQGLTLEVVRGDEVVACISPPSAASGFPVAELDRLLASLPRLSDEESREFLADMHEAMTSLAAGPDAWGS